MFRWLIPRSLLTLIHLLPLTSLGQSFTEIQPGLIKPSNLGYASWCDVNNDGFQDIFITGFNLIPDGHGDYIDFDYSMIYMNDQNGSFYESDIKNIPRGIYGSTAWGDFNNDGWADLVLTGTISGYASDSQTRLYINNRDGSFTLSGVVLPYISDSQTIWFDYNNDGWQDLFLIGIDASNNLVIKIMHNERGTNLRDSGIQFDVINGGMVNLGQNDAVIGDFDNDLDHDIMISQTSSGGYAIQLYENSNGSFNKKNTPLPQYSYATLATGDFNADGNLDVVINGAKDSQMGEVFITGAHFTVIAGDGKLNFSVLKEFNNQGSYWGSASAGDVNNDGLPDILINGTGNGSARTDVFININGKDFSKSNTGLLGTLLGESTLADFDNDGDLDALVIGSLDASSTTARSRLYRNDNVVINQRPSIPTNLQLFYDDDQVKLTWDKSTDDKTPQNSISYNVRISKQVEEDYLLSGLTNLSGDRQVDRHGNASLSNSLRMKIDSGTFYFQVQAVDAAYHESEFSPVLPVCIVAPPEVTYKTHYCYNEQAVITSSGEAVEIYTDAALTKLTYTGSQFTFAATASEIFYAVRVAQGCIRMPTIVSFAVSAEPHLQLMANGEPMASDTVLLGRCFTDQSFKIEATSNYPNIKISTANGSNEWIYIHEPGRIDVEASDYDGCSIQSTKTIDIRDYSSMYIPNVITPNADNKNDHFVLGDYPNVELTIINRQGARVFHSYDYQDDFDGSGLASGIYFYQVVIPGCGTSWKGALHIIHDSP